MSEIKSDEKEEKSDHVSLIKMIPQAFFDIIAYIIPGIFSIVIISIPLFDYEKLKRILGVLYHIEGNSYVPGALIFGFGLVFSYIFGVISSAIVETIFHSIFRENWNLERKKYREIKTFLPKAGQTILKVKAKRTMSKVLAIGVLISLAITISKEPTEIIATLKITKCYLYLAYLILLAGSVISIYNYWIIVNSIISDYYDILSEARVNQQKP